jgi:hypothetical protein
MRDTGDSRAIPAEGSALAVGQPAGERTARSALTRSAHSTVARPLRIGVQLWPGGAPSYQMWRQSVLEAEQLGVDVIFGYDHFQSQYETAARACYPSSRTSTISKAGPPWPLGARSRGDQRSACSLPGSGSATPTCSPTWRAPSITSAAADSSLASEPVGTKRITPSTVTATDRSDPVSTSWMRDCAGSNTDYLS